MTCKSIFLASIAAFTCMAFSPAQAALLNFDLSGSRDATFQLDSNPTPDTFSSSMLGSQIQFLDVVGTFGGVAGTATISFGTGPIFNVLDISGTPLSFTQFAGPNLFTGSAAMPVFSAGTFELTSIVSGSSTLTISLASVAPVPLPAALPLFAAAVVGFGLIRRRKTTPDRSVQKNDALSMPA